MNVTLLSSGCVQEDSIAIIRQGQEKFQRDTQKRRWSTLVGVGIGRSADIPVWTSLAKTAMSPSLPPEILDLIVDHLYDEPKTLKACCTVSKSWVSRTRRHLFADIEFHDARSPVGSWMKTFPDPSNTPAHHTRRLAIYEPPIITIDAAAWIRAFRRVKELEVNALGWDNGDGSLAHLHGLSPIINALHIVHHSLPPSEVFNLICSFPSLENLVLLSFAHSDTNESVIPSTSPKLTGTLHLGVGNETRSNLRRLLALPGGLHFSKISVTCSISDAQPTTDLVSRCSDTLRSLTISYYPMGTSLPPSMICQSMKNSPLPRCLRDVRST
jgi:hypothetical protein